MPSQRKTQIVAALIVMSLAVMSNLFFASYRYGFMNVARSVQVMATAAVIFGILKAHPAHKTKILLFWLAVSGVYLTILVCVIQDFFLDRFRFSYFSDFALLICGVLAAIGIGYKMNIIYEAYVELALEPVETAETAERVETVAETKPPTYENSIKDLTVSVEC